MTKCECGHMKSKHGPAGCRATVGGYPCYCLESHIHDQPRPPQNQCSCPQAITASEHTKTRLHPHLQLFPRIASTGINGQKTSYPMFELKDDD